MNEDIKEIEKTLPKLKDFHATYAGLSSDADALLDSIDQYSVSAISTEAVKTRAQEMQVHIQYTHEHLTQNHQPFGSF